MNVSQFRSDVVLLRGLLANDSEAVRQQIHRWQEADWERWSEFLNQHRIRGCFWYCVERDRELANSLPVTIRQVIERQLAADCERVESLRRLRVRVGKALEQQGLDYMVLKGEAVTARFYPAGQERHEFDLDVLVRERDVSRVVEAMQSLDLKLPGGLDAIKAHRLRSNHAETLTDGRHSLDLHWALRRGPAYRICMREVWDSRQWLRTGASELPSLSDEYLLVMMFVSLASDLGRGSIRLKKFVDLHYAIPRSQALLQSQAFWERRQQEGTWHVIRQTLVVLEAIFPDSIPEPLQSRTANAVSAENVWALVTNPPHAFENSLWLMRAYRLWRPTHFWSFTRQTISHPGRIPLGCYRLSRFLYRSAIHLFACHQSCDKAYD
jgi:hypothetical protein